MGPGTVCVQAVYLLHGTEFCPWSTLLEVDHPLNEALEAYHEWERKYATKVVHVDAVFTHFKFFLVS